MGDGYHIRELTPGDGPAIARLDRESPDTGLISFSTHYLIDPIEAIELLHPGADGAVAVLDGEQGIVGMAVMTTGTCRYEGRMRPYAYLFSVSVHPSYRRRGIASALYDWLIDTARRREGDDVVIVAGIQGGNEASLHTAKRWSTHLDRRTSAIASRMRGRPPRSVPGISVHEAVGDEWDGAAKGHNSFYAEYNLVPEQDGELLRSAHERGPHGRALRSYLVATDAAGRVVAGLSATDEGSLEPMVVVRMPRLLKAANALLKLVPATGMMRRIPVRGFWFAPGCERAARALWEHLRFVWRERGELVMAFVDPSNPLAAVIPSSPFLPKGGGYIALRAATSPSPDRLLYHYT
ncbi:MAG TPA: GNAT family N-acetyltransferase [Spirochaetia bacterium]|nr:GNAT family N-acetyltransferase [Spirochaetia bacterium]